MSDVNNNCYVIRQYCKMDDEIEVRYMCKDGYFVIHNIQNAQKFPQECEWLIDHIIDRWNSEYQHGVQAIYQKVLVRDNKEVME